MPTHWADNSPRSVSLSAPAGEPDARPITRPTPKPSVAITMRPPYRRGSGYIRCGLRLREALWAALQAHAKRHRRWASEVAEEFLREGLTRREVSLVATDPAPRPTPVPSSGRHWVRLAIPYPVWEVLQDEASARGISVAQLIQQKVYQAVNDGGCPYPPRL